MINKCRRSKSDTTFILEEKIKCDYINSNLNKLSKKIKEFKPIKRKIVQHSSYEVLQSKNKLYWLYINIINNSVTIPRSQKLYWWV